MISFCFQPARRAGTGLVRWGLLLLGAVLLVGVPDTRAQTPTTTVKDAGGSVVFQSFAEGQLLAPGPYDGDRSASGGAIPATGSGTRLMWWPEKAAFRAGRVGAFEGDKRWNASKVGEYSVAFGVDTKASGNSTTAMGSGTIASDFAATAMGAFTTASGPTATAMGANTIASGNQATAMGRGTIAATDQSLTIGSYNDKNRGNDDFKSTTGPLFVVGNGDPTNLPSSRSDALVLDQSGNLEVSGGFILPDGTKLDESSDLEGLATNANGASVVDNDHGFLATGAFGQGGSIPTEGPGTRMMFYPNKAAFRAGRVGGTQWDASKVGRYSVAFGSDTKASGNQATAMGRSTTASGDNATAMGSGATASGFAATAMGVATTAASDNSLSIGEYNSANTSKDNTLFVAGNGSPTSRSDALVLSAFGDLTISGHLFENSDRRLKKEIRVLGPEVLKKLSRLRPVRFEFKNQRTHPSGEQIGLIAQDVRKEFPSLVSKGPGGMLSLAYPKLTAVLLKGIQEQQTRLAKHQAAIDSLRRRIRSLETVKKRLAALEAKVSSEDSVLAGLIGSGADLLLASLVGGLLGAGLLWRRKMT